MSTSSFSAITASTGTWVSLLAAKDINLFDVFSPQQVKKKLQESLASIKKKHGDAYASDDQELTLLSIKSLEVS